MFYVPMIFMLVVTIWSLCQTVQSRFTAIFAGTAAFATYIQGVLAVVLVVLAVVLAIEGIQTIFGGKKRA